MKSFLEHVASDILAKYGSDLSRIAVVFPNKRASLFLNEYLARLSEKPIWSPSYTTISDLFCHHSQRRVADPIKLVCDLHRSFTAQTGIDETLDHFYGWGQLLLADFDDIDKQLAPADRIFANLSDLHELDDDSFLTDEQRAVLKRFFSNFSDEHNSELKQRFLRLWSRMGNIYTDFNQRLQEQNLAYEGALYKEVALNSSDIDFRYDHYLFVGFNALLKVEQKLFTTLRRQGKAHFYWDFDRYYMQHNEAGHFIGQYLELFPNEFDNLPQSSQNAQKNSVSSMSSVDDAENCPQSSQNTQKNSEINSVSSVSSVDDAKNCPQSSQNAQKNSVSSVSSVDDTNIYDNFRRPKQMRFISASTEDIQARYTSQWLLEQNRINDGRQTAVVLCDESLLPSVIHCLPDEVTSVNVTTGYPLAQAPVASLITLLIALRRDGFDHQRQHYRLRQVGALLRHPYLRAASPQVSALHQQLKTDKNYYPTQQELAIDDLTQLLFRPFGSQHQNSELLSWLCDVVQFIATLPNDQVPTPSPSRTGGELIKPVNETINGATDSNSNQAPLPHGRGWGWVPTALRLSPLREESLFYTFTLLQRLLNLSNSGDLQTDIITLSRLIGQLMQATTIPFHGEPVEGLQVMGLLETRNLDFKHLLVLSASEGNMPRGGNDTSFIPYALRRAYGLTTPDHKVAIYSYNFHRLLQRAADVTVVYNNSTADGQKGEMSRFLLQLMVEAPHPIDLFTLQGGQCTKRRQPQPLPNTAKLPEKLSPTAINRYLRCPLQFHYYYNEGLREPDDTDDDTIDNRLFGNIFHEAARIVYSRLMQQSRQIVGSNIDQLLKQQADIERAVDEAFRTELFQIRDERPNFHPRLSGLQIINRQVIIHYLRQLLTIDRQLAPFTILDLEGDVSMPLYVPDLDGGINVNIGGRIDRLDMITDASGQQRIRVIDYKTGAHRLNPLNDVEAIFAQKRLKTPADYYLQTMLYAIIVAQQHPHTPVAPALLFIQHAQGDDYDPILRFDKTPINDVVQHAEPFAEQLRQVIARMFDHSLPLEPTADRQLCDTCPYRQLCY